MDTTDNHTDIKENKHTIIEQSLSYQTLKKIKVLMEDYFLDGIIGLIPIVGDIFTQLFNVSFVYVSLFKIRSIPLTLAIIFNSLMDILIGVIPYAGMLLDFFHKSYKKNFEMIIGFVENDRQTIRKVNQKAVLMSVGIVVVIVTIYFLVKFTITLLYKMWDWVFNFINGI